MADVSVDPDNLLLQCVTEIIQELRRECAVIGTPLSAVRLTDMQVVNAQAKETSSEKTPDKGTKENHSIDCDAPISQLQVPAYRFPDHVSESCRAVYSETVMHSLVAALAHAHRRLLQECEIMLDGFEIVAAQLGPVVKHADSTDVENVPDVLVVYSALNPSDQSYPVPEEANPRKSNTIEHPDSPHDRAGAADNDGSLMETLLAGSSSDATPPQIFDGTEIARAMKIVDESFHICPNGGHEKVESAFSRQDPNTRHDVGENKQESSQLLSQELGFSIESCSKVERHSDTPPVLPPEVALKSESTLNEVPLKSESRSNKVPLKAERIEEALAASLTSKTVQADEKIGESAGVLGTQILQPTVPHSLPNNDPVMDINLAMRSFQSASTNAAEPSDSLTGGSTLLSKGNESRDVIDKIEDRNIKIENVAIARTPVYSQATVEKSEASVLAAPCHFMSAPEAHDSPVQGNAVTTVQVPDAYRIHFDLQSQSCTDGSNDHSISSPLQPSKVKSIDDLKVSPISTAELGGVAEYGQATIDEVQSSLKSDARNLSSKPLAPLYPEISCKATPNFETIVPTSVKQSSPPTFLESQPSCSCPGPNKEEALEYMDVGRHTPDLALDKSLQNNSATSKDIAQIGNDRTPLCSENIDLAVQGDKASYIMDAAAVDSLIEGSGAITESSAEGLKHSAHEDFCPSELKGATRDLKINDGPVHSIVGLAQGVPLVSSSDTHCVTMDTETLEDSRTVPKVDEPLVPTTVEDIGSAAALRSPQISSIDSLGPPISPSDPAPTKQATEHDTGVKSIPTETTDFVKPLTSSESNAGGGTTSNMNGIVSVEYTVSVSAPATDCSSDLRAGQTNLSSPEMLARNIHVSGEAPSVADSSRCCSLKASGVQEPPCDVDILHKHSPGVVSSMHVVDRSSALQTPRDKSYSDNGCVSFAKNYSDTAGNVESELLPESSVQDGPLKRARDVSQDIAQDVSEGKRIRGLSEHAVGAHASDSRKDEVAVGSHDAMDLSVPSGQQQAQPLSSQCPPYSQYSRSMFEEGKWSLVENAGPGFRDGESSKNVMEVDEFVFTRENQTRSTHVEVGCSSVREMRSVKEVEAEDETSKYQFQSRTVTGSFESPLNAPLLEQGVYREDKLTKPRSRASFRVAHGTFVSRTVVVREDDAGGDDDEIEVVGVSGPRFSSQGL